MPKEYTKDQLWKLYENLPEELKEAVFAEETAENIYSVCVKNGIEDERISEIARYAGHVLLGVLPPEEFSTTLEKELKLKKEIAKKAAQEINRFIFYPVRTDLEKLYQTKTAPVGETMPVTQPIAVEEVKQESPKKEDTYREPIE